MCIICVEFQRTKDLVDARRMLASARREPTAIPADHLQEVEQELMEAEPVTVVQQHTAAPAEEQDEVARA